MPKANTKGKVKKHTHVYMNEHRAILFSADQGQILRLRKSCWCGDTRIIDYAYHGEVNA